MSAPRAQDCGSCRYFAPSATRRDVVLAGDRGRCHRFPPQVVGASLFVEMFPVVIAGRDWCAEHETESLS